MGKENPVNSILEKHELLIVDGAMATELEGKGCDLNDTLWSAKVLKENPQLIREVHMDYFRAGADVAITASYQATIPGFVAKGYSEEEARKLIRKSVELAKEARDEFWSEYTGTGTCTEACGCAGEDREQEGLRRSKPLVAASIGPYGAYLADGSEYRGNYGVSVEFLKDFHRERLNLLLEQEPDLLACETLPNLDEAKAIMELIQEHPSVYAWFSFSCKDGMHISDGTEISQCAAYLSQFPQVVAVGLNCTAPEHVSSLIRTLKEASEKPVIIYPNSGEIYDPVHKVWHPGAPGTAFGDRVKTWAEDGAKLIGGCCRTKPSDIEALSKWSRKV